MGVSRFPHVMRAFAVSGERAGVRVEAIVTPLGDDVAIAVGGGAAHVGCTVLVEPREPKPLTHVTGLAGHRDDEFCQRLAEHVSARLDAVVTCSGGIHVDAITPHQIAGVLDLAQAMGEEIATRLEEERPVTR